MSSENCNGIYVQSSLPALLPLLRNLRHGREAQRPNVAGQRESQKRSADLLPGEFI